MTVWICFKRLVRRSTMGTGHLARLTVKCLCQRSSSGCICTLIDRLRCSKSSESHALSWITVSWATTLLMLFNIVLSCSTSLRSYVQQMTCLIRTITSLRTMTLGLGLILEVASGSTVDTVRLAYIPKSCFADATWNISLWFHKVRQWWICMVWVVQFKTSSVTQYPTSFNNQQNDDMGKSSLSPR